jgi:hypothetical protein
MSLPEHAGSAPINRNLADRVETLRADRCMLGMQDWGARIPSHEQAAERQVPCEGVVWR